MLRITKYSVWTIKNSWTRNLIVNTRCFSNWRKNEKGQRGSVNPNKPFKNVGHYNSLQNTQNDRSLIQTNDKRVDNWKQAHRSNSKKDPEIYSASSGEESDYEDFASLEAPEWSKIKIIEINKQFYQPSSKTNNRSEDEIEQFRAKNNIHVEGDALKPIFGFDELNFDTKQLINVLEKYEIKDFTPIQSYGLPLVFSGKNMIVVAPDGAGKLIATILSSIGHIQHQIPVNGAKSPIAVILVSSNEMVTEVYDIAKDICRSLNIKCDHIKHNSNSKPKICDLLISTPEALYDCIEKKEMNLHRCSLIHLNEVDRIIDLCFVDEIEEIVNSQIRSECQRIMWSSVWNADVRNFAVDVLKDFTKVILQRKVDSLEINRAVKQVVKVVPESVKFKQFEEFLEQIKSGEKTIVFTEDRDKGAKVVKVLRKNRLKSVFLLATDTKKVRETFFLEFQQSNADFFVLTDVTARHLQLNGMYNIINFDFPPLMREYLLRINRIENPRTVYTIFTEENGYMADEMIHELRKNGQDVNPDLYILQAANAESDDEISFAYLNKDGSGSFKKFTIDPKKQD